MAVSILNAWGGQTAGSPNGASLTISAGSDRLLVLSYMSEVGAFTYTSITVGGVAPTGTRISVNSTTTNQKIWTWFWDEAAIASMSGTTVTLTKTGSPSKHDYDYAVYQGAAGGAEFGTDVESGSTTSLTPVTTSASVADDFIAVFNNRSSPNRDITGYDNLTEEWIFRTDYCISIADGAGGDDSVAMTGDATAGDWIAQILHIKSSAGGGSGSTVLLRNTFEGYINDC